MLLVHGAPLSLNVKRGPTSLQESLPIVAHRFSGYEPTSYTGQLDIIDEWAEDLQQDVHAEGDHQDEQDLAARMGRDALPMLGKSRLDILTVIERTPVMTELLKRPEKSHGRYIEREEIEHLRSHFPPPNVRIVSSKMGYADRKGPWLLSLEDEARAQQGRFLKLGEYRRLRRMVQNSDSWNPSNSNAPKRVIRGTPAINSGSKVSISAEDSSASATVRLRAGVRTWDLKLQEWAAQKPRLARKRRRNYDGDSSAFFSDPSTRSTFPVASNTLRHPQWSAKKFRGQSSSDTQRSDPNSWGSPVSKTALRSPGNLHGVTSWDPPLEDRRSLSPGSHWINPIVVDSPSPTPPGADQPTSPVTHPVHNISNSE